METSSNKIRKFMSLLESSYEGPITDINVSYEVEKTKNEITKVIAYLRSYKSAEYTRLGNNLAQIEKLTEEINLLKEQVKQDSRELIADLFNADDIIRTRVVETVSFTFTLTKNPKPTNTVSYTKVLDELQKSLTPELIVKLNELKAKYTSTTQKSPALSYQDKRIKVEEDIFSGIMSYIKTFLNSIRVWSLRFDLKLDKLKDLINE